MLEAFRPLLVTWPESGWMLWSPAERDPPLWWGKESLSALAQTSDAEGQREEEAARVSKCPVPAAGAGERALEQDQEPGWLAGRRRQAASPAESRDLALAQMGR